MDLVFSVLDILILQNYFPHNNFKLGDLEKEKNQKKKSRGKETRRKEQENCERCRLMIFFNKKQRRGSFNCLLIHMFLESEF